jgi:PAS domain S-box-containing protein
MSQKARVFPAFRNPQGLLAEPPEYVEFLPIAVYACDAEGRVRWFNSRAAALWGRTPRIGDDTELFCGSFQLYSLTGEPIHRTETPMAYVLRTGEPVHDREAIVVRPDDSRVVAMVHIDPIKDESGTLLGAINCFHETTELHRIKSEAAENGALFRQLLDALPAAIYTTDAKGVLTYYNRAAVDLAGREPELGKDEWCVTWKLYTPDGKFLPHDQCPMATALRENRPVRGLEAQAERPDGTRWPFLPFPTPLRDLSGKLVGAVNMLVDISDRKDAETRQKSLLAELNHRVKNNMQMLHALLRGAERETDNAEAEAILRAANRRVGAMAAAQQVLYDAKSAMRFDAADFLRALCRVAQQGFSDQAAIVVHADEGMLANDAAMPLALILNELLTNAVSHARRDGRPVGVRVALDRDSDGWHLSVADDGPGFVLAPARRRASGLGLVSGLAGQLGGHLTVQRDKGAHCVVDFPAAQAAV